VPGDYPTIAAALAAASPGDVVGVCTGEWVGGVDVPSCVHLVGVSRDLVRVVPDSTNPGLAVVRVSGMVDSTAVAELTLDGLGLVPQVVLVEAASTGLHLMRDVITGGASYGVRNGADSRVLIGGSLACANDLFGNGSAIASNVRNDNVSADSLDATHNWWGLEDYNGILATIEGPVLICPFTNAEHQSTGGCLATSAPVVGGILPSLVVVPNPTRGETLVSFVGQLGRATTIQVYDVVGGGPDAPKRSAPETRGQVWWNGRDQQNRVVAPGVYFVRLESGQTLTRKIVLVR
jgi:hypothetical protein